MVATGLEPVNLCHVEAALYPTELSNHLGTHPGVLPEPIPEATGGGESNPHNLLLTRSLGVRLTMR